MARLITIAGPQSSGKTTFLNVLKNRYQGWRFIPEAVFTDEKFEFKIIKNELSLLKSLDDKRTTIIETGIFHLVYSEKICGAKITQNYFKKYLSVYKKFEPLIFFIDTKPEVSWRRCQDKYLNRIKSLGINDEQETAKRLSKYQKNLYALYPLWFKYLEKIPYHKIIFRNSYIAEDEFIREAFLQFQKFLLQ